MSLWLHGRAAMAAAAYINASIVDTDNMTCVDIVNTYSGDERCEIVKEVRCRACALHEHQTVACAPQHITLSPRHCYPPSTLPFTQPSLLLAPAVAISLRLSKNLAILFAVPVVRVARRHSRVGGNSAWPLNDLLRLHNLNPTGTVHTCVACCLLMLWARVFSRHKRGHRSDKPLAVHAHARNHTSVRTCNRRVRFSGN
jgi:hypothetical protein